MFLIPKARRYAPFLLAIVVLVLSGCTKLHDATLENGMRVVVKEDHRAPVVVSMVWYRVGSVDEPPGLTGVSHVVEHMMFKGTGKLKSNEFSRIIAENGGSENAFTSADYTAYFQQLEKSRLPIALELEADRMQYLTLDEVEFRKEILVVMEERRLRTDDRPDGLLREKFMAEAYQSHPYAQPVIGWMEDLKRLKIADVRDWYRRWYTPSNATLVVVGDVNPKEVIALAKKYFGPIPARAVERTPIPPVPKQEQPRRLDVRLPAEVPYLTIGYHVPVLEPKGSPEAKQYEPWEIYALDVLVGVLDGGASARFETELVRNQRVASRIGTSYGAVSRYPTLLTIGGSPTADRTTADLERAIYAQLERIKNEPVSAAELDRVKAQVVAEDVYARDSGFYAAMQMGALATADLDLALIDQDVARLKAVTAEQVMAVARKYLRDENRVVGVLHPLPASQAPRRPRPALGEGARVH
jgi:zinc protease